MNEAALDKLIRALRRAGLEFTGEDLADAMWLAPRLPHRTVALQEFGDGPGYDSEVAPSSEPSRVDSTRDRQLSREAREMEMGERKGVDVRLPSAAAETDQNIRGVMVRLPDAFGLPSALGIARAMRPLRKQEETSRFFYLDELKTAERIAASDIWLPLLFPGKERWLNAALVFDTGASMAIWQKVLREFRHLLETLGAFRRVRQWWLDSEHHTWNQNGDNSVPLFAMERSRAYRRSSLDVVDPTGRQIILVFSDCVSDAWWDGRMARLLDLWGKKNHTAILQMLPHNMWDRTGVGPDQGVLLRSKRAACPNACFDSLVSGRLRELTRLPGTKMVSMPVLEMSSDWLGRWSRWVTKTAGEVFPGRLLRASPEPEEGDEDDAWSRGVGQPFLTLASKTARKLANIMAVAPPFNLPLLRVIRESMLGGEATQIHEAEFLLGGLVEVIEGYEFRFERPDEVVYDFRSQDLRKLLRPAVPVSEAVRLLRIEQVSKFLGQRLGQRSSFPACLESPNDYQGSLQLAGADINEPIACFASGILLWLGGKYAGLVQTRPKQTPTTRKLAIDGTKFRFLSARDVRAALTMSEGIELMKQAFRMLSSGAAVVPPRTHIEVFEKTKGDALFMPCYVPGTRRMGMKIVTQFDENASRGLPFLQALMVLLDSETGRTLALMDGKSLTAICTGAATGAATDLLARADASTVAVFGAGPLARAQLEAVCQVRSIRSARIFDVDDNRAVAFAREMGRQLAIVLQSAESPEAALRHADIVCTATTSSTPVFEDDHLPPGAHLNAIGSYKPGEREIPGHTVKRARVIVDHLPSALIEAGDLIIPLEQGLVGRQHFDIELGEVVAGKRIGRESAEQITLFKSVGIAVQDLMAASTALDNATRLNLGTELEL